MKYNLKNRPFLTTPKDLLNEWEKHCLEWLEGFEVELRGWLKDISPPNTDWSDAQADMIKEILGEK